jgi:hypothetical protein
MMKDNRRHRRNLVLDDHSEVTQEVSNRVENLFFDFFVYPIPQMKHK